MLKTFSSLIIIHIKFLENQHICCKYFRLSQKIYRANFRKLNIYIRKYRQIFCWYICKPSHTIARKNILKIWKRFICCRIYLCIRDIFSFCEFGSILSALCFSAQAARRVFFGSRWIYLHSSILSEFARSGFPVGLTFRSLRITFLREGEKLLFPKGKSIIPVYTLASLFFPLSLSFSLYLSISLSCLRECIFDFCR